MDFCSTQCWGARRALEDWEFKNKHRLIELPQGSRDWHETLKRDRAEAARKCETCAGQAIKVKGGSTMAETKAVSGAAAFRNAIEEKKLTGDKAIAFIAKATGKEFTEAKYTWYSNLYKEGKLGGIPAATLKAKVAKKVK